jgi:hypothetical protein
MSDPDCILLDSMPRVPFEAAKGTWGAKRRELYLVRKEVPCPLSVDPLVWPALELNSSHWRGHNSPLWENLQALRTALSSRAGTEEHLLIALGACSSPKPRRTDGETLDSPFTQPSSVQPAWEFLGYDVADGGLISGLTNCGYGTEENARLAARWLPHLNAYHLFSDLDPATSFRDMTNARVPEHAPFYVIALWRVPA